MATQTRNVALSLDTFCSSQWPTLGGLITPDQQWVIGSDSATVATAISGYDGERRIPLMMNPVSAFAIPSGARVTRLEIQGQSARTGQCPKFAFTAVQTLEGYRPNPLTDPLLRTLSYYNNGFGETGTGEWIDGWVGGTVGVSIASFGAANSFTAWMDCGLFPDGAFSIGGVAHPSYLFAEPSAIPAGDSLVSGVSSSAVRDFINASSFGIMVHRANYYEDGLLYNEGSLTLSNLSITVHYTESGPFWEHLTNKSEEVD